MTAPIICRILYSDLDAVSQPYYATLVSDLFYFLPSLSFRFSDLRSRSRALTPQMPRSAHKADGMFRSFARCGEIQDPDAVEWSGGQLNGGRIVQSWQGPLEFTAFVPLSCRNEETGISTRIQRYISGCYVFRAHASHPKPRDDGESLWFRWGSVDISVF